MARIWLFLRWLPAVAIAIGMLLSLLALWTDDMILDADPCASSDDHPLVGPAGVVLTAACCLALINIPLGLASRTRRNLRHSVLWLGLSLCALVVGRLFAIAGYGWHC